MKRQSNKSLILAAVFFLILSSENLFCQTAAENAIPAVPRELPLHYLVFRGNIASDYYAFSSLDHTARVTSFAGGFAHDYWFNKNMAITSELVYLQKKFNLPIVKFHYMSLDILFKISSVRIMYAAVGLGFDFLFHRNHDPEHVHVSPVNISLIIALGFYFNLWNNDIFFNAEIRVRAMLNYVEFLTWGKRHIAHTSIEFGIAVPLYKKK